CALPAIRTIPLRLECLEVTPGTSDDIARYARELRNLQSVAAAGRPFLHRVQEDDAVAVLSGIEVHVRTAFHLGCEGGQLEVVGGEQGERFDACGNVVSHRPREGQPVERARSATDLVHQDEAAGGRVVQNVGG